LLALQASRIQAIGLVSDAEWGIEANPCPAGFEKAPAKTLLIPQALACG
jgi:hypothetical protein